MRIDKNTSIKQLLDEKQDEVIEALISINKNFGKLKNPILRKLLAKRVSIEEACKIASCNIADFLKSMEQLGFQIDEISNEQENSLSPETSEPRVGERLIELDVRPILAADKDPLKQIMIKVNELQDGDCLKIINTFQPLPLINLLGSKGFQSKTDFIKADLVHTYFFKVAATRPPKELIQEDLNESDYDFDAVLEKYRDKVKVLDVTMFEMPKPMMTILESIDELKEDEALFVEHKKVPVYLLPHLREKGFEYLIREESSTEVSILIYRP